MVILKVFVTTGFEPKDLVSRTVYFSLLHRSRPPRPTSCLLLRGRPIDYRLVRLVGTAVTLPDDTFDIKDIRET